MAYTNNPTGNPRDAIRLLAGDISTSTGSELLSDVDYDFMLTQGPTYVAAQLACNSLSAKFQGVAADVKRKKVGDLEIEYVDATDAAQGYKQLSQKFGRMAAAQVSPYAGGISRSDKQVDELDTDRVSPYFARGLFDNPAVMAFTGRGSTST